MEPSDFQKNWVKWKVSKEIELSLENDLEKKEDLIELFEKNNIFCIASRESQDEIKFYFYCQDQSSQCFYQMEINVVDKDEFSMTVKGENESDLIGQVMNLVEQILRKNKYID